MTKPATAIRLPSVLAPFKTMEDVRRVVIQLAAMAAERRAAERARQAAATAKTGRYTNN